MNSREDKRSERTRIVDDRGHCSLCEGTHYGTGPYTCPFQCDRCRVNTDQCFEEGCPRNARYKSETEEIDRRKSAASPPTSAKQQFDEFIRPEDATTPLERLRFFCSIAMSGQDWLDAEPFFDALEKQLAKAYETIGQFAGELGAAYEIDKARSARALTNEQSRALEAVRLALNNRSDENAKFAALKMVWTAFLPSRPVDMDKV